MHFSSLRQMTTKHALSVFAVTAALGLAACSSDSNIRTVQQEAIENTSPADQEFITDAIDSGYSEIILAQYAREKSADEDVQDFAQELIDDHGEANEKLTDLAVARAIELPDFHDDGTVPNNPVDMLVEETSPKFDQDYLAMMVENHQKAIAKFESVSATTSDDELADFVDDTPPVIRGHLERARELSVQMAKK